MIFQNILVPLDGSPFAEAVLPHVTSLSKNGTSTIHLLSIVETLPPGMRRRSVDPFDWVVRKAENEAYLNSIAGMFQSAGHNVRVEVREGQAAEQILDYASQNEVDLIVLSDHGQSGLTGWSIGSTVQKIVAGLFVSVFLVPATDDPPKEVTYSRIFLPLDGSARAECIFPSATNLARSQQALLILAHVIERPRLPGRMPPSSEDSELAERLVKRQKELGEAYLDDVQARIDANTKPVLQIGASALDALHELANREAIDMVVLCAHGHTGSAERALGTTGYSFIASGRWPMLIIQDIDRSTGPWSRRGTTEERGTR